MSRALLGFAILAVAIVACSDDTGTTPGLEKRTPQFRKDVMPLLEQYCATSACHLTEDQNLGITLKVADPAAVYAELKKDSPTAKGNPFVVPGDPKKSFLQAKIDGTQAEFEQFCLLPACGEIMPPGASTKLTPRQRDVFREWIAAGAKDD